jgi:hypothetical protein
MQLPLVNNDDVVQALAANTTDDPLHETILPRTQGAVRICSMPIPCTLAVKSLP